MAQSLFGKFISSMIHQVGRDTGKVISNAVYKDAHATPVRRVYSQPKKATKTIRSTNTKQREEAHELTRSILGDLIK